MSGDYISREAALEVVERYFAEILELNPDICLDGIKSIPDADVVEVVRCRECEHSIMHKFPYIYEKVLACNDPHGVTIKAVKPMHFCSYGERKEDGEP